MLDLREEGEFTQGHLLLAASLPIGRLELDLPWRVPNRRARVVLVGGDAARIGRAVKLLQIADYSKLFILKASKEECERAGMGWFSGKFVPSKAFGEVVETAKQTPHIDIARLTALRNGGAKLLMVDSRTPEEFEEFSLPGAVSCPGAELALRVPGHVEPDTIVLVNCAGRTRSIIGAQSLVNAGLTNPVYAIENGTMGWRLDGRELQRGSLQLLERAGETARERLEPYRASALELLQRTGGSLIGWDELQRRLGDPEVTTYFYDVRLQSDFQQGTFPYARSAPGGEFVQSTDYFAPVRNARIVVADTDLVQAPMTAHWLRQMGWDADVLDPATAPPLTSGTTLGVLPQQSRLVEPEPVDAISVQALAACAGSAEVAIIDCSSSIAFRRAHIPGAWFCTRAALSQGLQSLPETVKTLVFTAADPALAHFAAADARSLGWTVQVLAQGNHAWSDAGMPMEQGAVRHLCEPNDIWYSPYEVEPHRQAAAMREYIAWEIGLAQRVETEPGIAFQVL